MNLGQYLFGSLQEMGRVELPNFGVFSLQKKSAILNEEDATLLPPTYEIFFEKNDSILNSDFAKYISEKSGENLFIVQSELKDQIQSWKQELAENKKFLVEELGEFSEENGSLKLLNKSNFVHNSNFFGLEEISLKEIKENKVTADKKDSEDDYVFSKSILWAFLFIIPVGGILFLAIMYQDKIFGKKSFDMTIKTSTHRIEEKPLINKDPAKIDSIKSFKKDSLKTSK